MDIIAEPQTQLFTTEKPNGNATLEELRKIKAEWVQEAIERGYFESLHMITKEMGGKFEIPNWNTWEAWRFHFGNVELKAFEYSTHFVPSKGKFNHVWSLIVYAGDHLVCQYKNDDRWGPQKGDLLIVPGNWLNQALGFEEQAIERMAERQATSREYMRRQLITRLFIGVEV